MYSICSSPSWKGLSRYSAFRESRNAAMLALSSGEGAAASANFLLTAVVKLRSAGCVEPSAQTRFQAWLECFTLPLLSAFKLHCFVDLRLLLLPAPRALLIRLVVASAVP